MNVSCWLPYLFPVSYWHSRLPRLHRPHRGRS